MQRRSHILTFRDAQIHAPPRGSPGMVSIFHRHRSHGARGAPLVPMSLTAYPTPILEGLVAS